MSIVLCCLNLIIYALITFRLITTNHWTTGKKLLVAIVGAMVWFQGMMLALVLTKCLIIPLSAFLLSSVPLTIAGLITVWAIYRRQLE